MPMKAAVREMLPEKRSIWAVEVFALQKATSRA